MCFFKKKLRLKEGNDCLQESGDGVTERLLGLESDTLVQILPLIKHLTLTSLSMASVSLLS